MKPARYLKQHQTEYYRRQPAIRTDGDWESWVTFFLEGVATAAGDAEKTIIEVACLVATDRRHLLQSAKASPVSYRLFEMLPMIPRFTIERVRQQLDTSFPTATAAVKTFSLSPLPYRAIAEQYDHVAPTGDFWMP